MLQGFGRPDAAASLHICFAEYLCSTLHARVKRSFAAVSTHTHTCVSEKVNSSLHTKIKRYKGLANQVLLWARMCPLQDESIQGGLDQGFQRLAHQLLLQTHTYACRRKICRVEPWVARGVANQVLHTHVRFRKTVQGCTQGSKVTRDWPTNCCCEHTHVCCRVYQFRVAPISVKGYNSLADQLLLREHTCDMCVAEKKQLRVGLADHILKREHTCVVQNISHLRAAPKVKAYNYKGLADQGLLRKYTCVSQNK